jgi:hypothetical protein
VAITLHLLFFIIIVSLRYYYSSSLMTFPRPPQPEDEDPVASFSRARSFLFVGFRLSAFVGAAGIFGFRRSTRRPHTTVRPQSQETCFRQLEA